MTARAKPLKCVCLWGKTRSQGKSRSKRPKSAPSRHQVEILHKCHKDSALLDLMAIAGRSDRTKFRHQVLNPLLEEGLIEMTVPDKPRSSKQKYLKVRDVVDYVE